MRRASLAVCVAAAIAVLAGPVPRAQERILELTASRAGAPAAGVQVEFQLINGGKPQAGATGVNGDLALALSAANLGKPTRMQVVVYDCPNDTQVIVFVEYGAEPEDRNCRRSILGILWFGRDSAAAIDLTTMTMQVQGGSSFWGSRRTQILIGAGAAAAVTGVVAAGGSGGSSGAPPPTPPANNPPPSTPPPSNPPPSTPFNPDGAYEVTIAVHSDPAGHAGPIGMESRTVLTIDVNGSSIRITCPAGSKLTLLTGTFNPGNGDFTVSGRGPAAGFSNIPFTAAGTITVAPGASQGRLIGLLRVGPTGLPGNVAIDYRLEGSKRS